ncbi:MAG: NAD(P)H-hydrate epimerase, partial [Pyrinomonadaceae bacterium]
MQKVLTAEEMREVDRQTTEKYGIPSILLMENAAHAAARVITEKLGGSVAGKSFLILCGKGNNGGDGAALARILWEQDVDVFVIILGKIKDTKGDAKVNFEFLEKLYQHDALFIDYWEIETYNEFFEVMENFLLKHPVDIIVDAIFGTGLTRKLADYYKQIAHYSSQYIVGREKILLTSLDLPSGLNADLSEPIGTNIKADLTVTFTAPKLANVFPPASNFNGELVIANIGSPQELIDNSPSKIFVSENEDAQSWLNKTKVQTNS